MATIKSPSKPSPPVTGRPEEPSSSYATLCLPDNTLEQQLLAIKNTEVRIAVAFASKTVQLVKSILNNQNHLRMIVGTINHFTDPVFIKECAELAARTPQRFQFYVDFRGDDSIHWKLYLMSPNRTIIGSPNLTRVGISMQRDIAASVTDVALWEASVHQFIQLQQKDTTVQSADLRFSKMLEAYRDSHRALSAQYQRHITTHYPQTAGKTDSFVSWLAREHTHVLPIYIWDEELSEEQIRLFNEKVQPKLKDTENIVFNSITLVGAYVGKKDERRYGDGDVVLMMKPNGSAMEFVQFDLVFFAEGHWWVCQYAFTKTIAPFTITSELRRVFKTFAADWYRDSKTFLDTRDLNSIAKSLRTTNQTSTK